MITFNNIVERFEVFAENHFFINSFSFGSPDDVDLSKFEEFPLMHLVYTGATYDAGTKTYNLEVYILDVPSDKKGKVIPQKEAISDAEQCAEDILADIRMGGNIFLFAQDYEVVNATTTPLEEETKNVLSGVLLDLSVAIPYEWDACNAPIDGVAPGGGEVVYARRGILRMLTLDGATDVKSVRTIKVTNGTLTDDGDGVVTLDTGGVETLGALTDVTLTNLQTGQQLIYDHDGTPRGFFNGNTSLSNLTDTTITTPAANSFLRYVSGSWQAVPVAIPSPAPTNTDGLPEGTSNLYYTEARVEANTDVTANTAKVGITPTQASEITANTAKTGITSGQASAITANTAKVGITTQQANDITANNAKIATVVDDTSPQLGGNLDVQAREIDTSTTNGNIVVAPNGTGVLEVKGDTNSAAIQLNCEVNTHGVKIQAPPHSAGATYSLTLPNNTGTNGQALTTDGNGVLSFSDVAAGTKYHDRFQTNAETFRSGATATVELYYTAKADGDGLAESASSDTPTAGKIIKRKIYYSEAAFADPDTGTWVEFTPAPADDASFATVKAALLEYLKARTGGTVPISLKQTWEEVAAAPSFTGLLNETYGSGAEAAYSTRRLNGNVTECMVIRRASDSTTSTIGFDGSGNIDESAITTFCTGTTCTVSEWKDQSGNGNDATQATASAQPTIYTGGAIVKENGKLALDFGGTSELNFTTIAKVDVNPFAVFAIAQDTVGNLLFVDSTDNQNDALLVFTSYGQLRSMWNGSMYLDFINSDGLYRLFSVIDDGTNAVNTFYSGELVTDSSFQVTNKAINLNRIGGTGYNASQKYAGIMQEAIFYASDKSTDRTSIEENIGDYFTQNTPLLDTYSGAAAAYSLRLLDSTYTGSAIRVRRSSDNTEQDIGFNVFSELDTVSLTAFAGTGDAFVKTWYSQTGSNDATQAVTGRQPQIVSSGAVIVDNGKPAVQFDGSDDTLQASVTSSNIISTNAENTLLAVMNQDSTSVSNGLVSMANPRYVTYTDFNGTLFYDAGNNSSNRLSVAAPAGWDDAQHILFWSSSLTLQQICVDGTQLASNTSQSTVSSASTTLIIGAYTSAYLKGLVQEIVLYPSDEYANRTNIETNVNTFYNIY